MGIFKNLFLETNLNLGILLAQKTNLNLASDELFWSNARISWCVEIKESSHHFRPYPYHLTI